jgi:ribosomal subunit interface protein
MTQKLEIDGVHATVNERLHKYVVKKIGNLDKYMSRHVRLSAHAEVKLKEAKAKDKNRHTCEVVLHLPHEIITVKETTMNIYAAIDIVEAKLKNQLKKYKDLHSPRLHRRAISRFKRSFRPDL